MKINGELTLLFNKEGLHIELHDLDSGTIFVEIDLNQDQTCKAMSRLARTKCEKFEVYNLDKIGKLLEHNSLEFKIADEHLYSNREEIAKQKAKENCPKGWEPNLHFRSQDSFFYKGEELWARTIIRRYVEKENENDNRSN